MFVFLLAGSSCENPAATDTHIGIQQNQIAEAFFNPQPEPPPKVYEFEIVGDPDGDWIGRFPGFDRIGVKVQTLNSMRRGKTVQVEQTWTFVPPENIFPQDEIEPVNISLKGILNLANNTVVLNGMSDELGVNVHVRGQLITLESGDISIGGELMFNPQPEPPPGS